MAGAKGLEPSAFCVTGRRYNQLNYAPANEVNIEFLTDYRQEEAEKVMTEIFVVKVLGYGWL